MSSESEYRKISDFKFQISNFFSNRIPICRDAFSLLPFAFCLIVFVCSLSAQEQQKGQTEQLYSPSVGKKIYEIAYELSGSEEIEDLEITQGIAFMVAIRNLDDRADYLMPTLLKLASSHPENQYTQLVYSVLGNYVNDTADLEIVRKAIRGMLNQFDSREEREGLLGALLQNIGTKNRILGSELATLLGALYVEKSDTETALSLFRQAYSYNRFNRLAFAKLTELETEEIPPLFYFERLRLMLMENPLDIETAMNLAQYAEKMQLYQQAAQIYKYCADLFEYFYPSQPIPASIYLPWMISNYNIPREEYNCLTIVKRIRQSGRFDLLAEVIAAKAALKTADTNLAKKILRDAEKKALELSIENRKSKIENCQPLAWFYCFAQPNADKALDWANKAYSNEPNSATAAAVLAYAFVMNEQKILAGELIKNYPQNQIADLTLAKIQAASGNNSQAIKALKSAISADPGTLEAHEAKHILAELGGEYVGTTDPDVVLAALKNRFDQSLVPKFLSPEQILSVHLNIRGNTFSYGSVFSGSMAITNNSSEPLIVSDDSLFKGYIRVDADITGDINKKIPNLVSRRFLPAKPIEAGRSELIHLHLFSGELREILLSHPQASLEIEFTAYIDPVVTPGLIQNHLAAVAPAKMVIKRPAVKITGKSLQNKINDLPQTRQNQKIKTARLFVGLLMEQQAMANRDPLYKLMHANWMPKMLKSGLVYCLNDKDWVTKTQTMIAMVPLPLDYELTEAVAQNLNDTNWPVRLIAIYLLSKSQDRSFDKVLDWTAKYDKERVVREMAVGLGAVVPEIPQQPTQPGSGQAGPTQQQPGSGQAGPTQQQPGSGQAGLTQQPGQQGRQGRITR